MLTRCGVATVATAAVAEAPVRVSTLLASGCFAVCGVRVVGIVVVAVEAVVAPVETAVMAHETPVMAHVASFSPSLFSTAVMAHVAAFSPSLFS